MLKALYDYANRHELVLPPGCVKKTVKAFICLNADGSFQFVEAVDNREVIAPDIGSLANGKDKSNIIVEKRSVVIPSEPTAKSQFFLKALHQGGEQEPMLEVCAQALENPDTAAQIRAELDKSKIKDSDRVTFKVEYQPVLKSSHVLEWWAEYRRQFQKPDTEEKTVCLVTGQPTVPQATTPKINGLRVVGGHSSGDALICFDKNAFCSYDLKKAANAPVSEEAFAAVKAALDHLLEDAPVLAGMKFVHWYDVELSKEDDPICQLVAADWGDEDDDEDEDEEEEAPEEALKEQEIGAVKNANAVVESVWSGQDKTIPDNTNYYIMMLSGVGGRIMIRRYERGNYQELCQNLKLWQKDLELVNSINTDSLPSCKLYARLIRLMKYQSGDRKQFDRLNKELAGITPAVLTAILSGSQLPDSVAARALAYIRSRMLDEAEDSERKSTPVLDGRSCQWLKAWLIRKDREKGKELMSCYNLQHSEPAYHCGGLMAVYATIQQRAMPDVNAGVILRYYSSASRTPALVLGQLDRLSKYHLDKLDKPFFYQRKTAELYEALGNVVPVTLNLKEQSYFALGYYQKWAELHQPTEKKQDAESTNQENQEG
jgi:CRISPR-associated protein Csd1